MKNRIARERVIFNNYNLEDMYDDCKAWIMERDEYAEDDGEPDESEVWDEVYNTSNMYFEEEFERMQEFFSDGQYIIFGNVGRWDGIYSGMTTFTDFRQAFCRATQDCNYIKIYDVNGHFHITCSHHDGTCHYEIKKLTDAGVRYLNNWEYSYEDSRSAGYVNRKIVERYSVLPRYAEKVYGCKRAEYIPVTKEALVNALSNEARSNYC